MSISSDDVRVLRKVALAMLVNGPRMLFYLRDNNPTIYYPNTWALIGGQVELGESPIEAIRREMQEEIGCGADDLRFVREVEIIDNPACDDQQVFLFCGRIDRSLESLHLTEGQKLAYFTQAEFEAARFAPVLRSDVLQAYDTICRNKS